MYHQCCVSKNRLLAMIAIVVFFSFSSALAEDSRDLVFLTWSEYMDPKLIEKFENRFNTKVKFAYFESDELRDDMLLNSDGAVYDVICLNGRSIKTYSKQDWLAPMTTKDVPNKKHIDPRWAEAFEGAAEYAVPFFWGTIGIAYREDVVKQPISSWKQLIEPAPELQGRIVLVKDARDLMVMALKSQGYSINTSNHQELDKAKSLLLAQKPYVHDYSYISLTEESALVTGDAVAALAYNGDALTVAEHDENIKYVVPEEGTAIWIDYLAVSKASKKKSWQWISSTFSMSLKMLRNWRSMCILPLLIKQQRNTYRRNFFQIRLFILAWHSSTALSFTSNCHRERKKNITTYYRS